MPVEQLTDGFGVPVGEVGHIDVGGGERAVAQVGPGRDLQGFEPMLGRPSGDLLQAQMGQAGSQESKLHSGTSTQARLLAESTTAWVRIAARRPSAKVGSPSGCAPVTAA